MNRWNRLSIACVRDMFAANMTCMRVVLSASPGALGGLRSQSHLVPLLLNLQCWVAPKAFALGKAGEAFDADGKLVTEFHVKQVQAVIDQVLFAAASLQP